MQRQVDGITLAYDVQGNGPWLLLCHSLGMNREIWFQQVPEFARNYRVLTYDARGHGESSKPPGPYSYELLAEDLRKLLAAEGVERAAVVGLSLGGNTAQALASSHPELVAALVLSDTTAWYGPEGEKNWETRARDLEERGFETIIDFQLTRWFTDDYRAAHPDLMKRFAGWLTANDLAAYTACQRALGKGDLREAVARITCPTLITVGEGDYATPPVMAQDLNARIAGSELVILPSARHFSPVEQAERFNAAVLDFLARAGY